MIDWMLVANIAGPVIAAVFGFFLNRFFESRARLIAYYGEASAFRMSGATPLWLHTHSIVVRNSGRQTASNVRLGHANLPPDFVINPDVAYEVADLPGGTKEIVVPRLLPGGQITVAYLYYPPMLWRDINTYVTSDEGYAKIVTVLPQKQTPKWFNVLAAILFLVGGITVIYLAAQALSWVFAGIDR